MFIRQAFMVLSVVRDNPGLDIAQLCVKIEEEYGQDNIAVQFMFLEDRDKSSHLMSIFDRLYCVEKKGDLYFFNGSLPVTDKSDLLQLMIRGRLEKLKEQEEAKKDDSQ